jgi:hypothetical protein
MTNWRDVVGNSAATQLSSSALSRMLNDPSESWQAPAPLEKHGRTVASRVGAAWLWRKAVLHNVAEAQKTVLKCTRFCVTGILLCLTSSMELPKTLLQQ